MKIIQITNPNDPSLAIITDWFYDWWGKRNGDSYAKVETYTKHLIVDKHCLPCLFTAMENNEVIGVYTFVYYDDMEARPDLYPWLANVYVKEDKRHQGIGRQLLESVKANAKAYGLDHLYLYTQHTELYEKFGWHYVDTIQTYNENEPTVRLYYLNIES